MPKKSKLTESPARFTSGLDEKLKSDFQKYLQEISAANVETARSFRFSMLLKDWFADARPNFVEDYLKGMERHVRVKQKDIVLAGRIDALYGNAIIEFESNLTKKLKEAKRQLQQYFFSLTVEEATPEANFLCIATDGVLFQVFTPVWLTGEIPKKLEDIELRELDRVDFGKIDGAKAFLWIDRYFFRTKELHPTSDEFVRDFGINSPAYAFAIKLLEAEWKRSGHLSELKVIYENWEKYLRIAYGTSVADDELFLRHTYLASFAKLLAFMRLSGKSSLPTQSEIVEIFTGRFFKRLGIQNFLDEDFLSWIGRERVRDALLKLTRGIATLLENYYLQEISEDVLKSLYQELVDPVTRHDLGEFYTPDWLADRIVRHALQKTPKASVLDPACGSGSFLYFTIRYKREKLGDSETTLQHIRDNVVGIDIHPLAVTIAKTNYLLGLGELLRRRVKDFHIPIYMANSIRLPWQPIQIGTLEKVPSIRVNLDDDHANIPDVFLEHPTAYDQAIEFCHDFAVEHSSQDLKLKRFRGLARQRLKEVPTDDDTIEVLFDVAVKMHRLIKKNRNSIWAFILKNVYRPLFLKQRFDWILGNPPWLTLKDVEKGDYQDFLKKEILDEYSLLDRGKGHLVTHLELGTLFFCASLYVYGKRDAGSIAFVLPRSVFTADQHEKFRTANIGKSMHDIGITEVWDLDGVTPLFRIPANVAFGTNPHATPNPFPAEVFSGELPRKNASLKEAGESLSVRRTKLYSVKQGERSFWSEDPRAEVGGKSPYGSKFAEGATMFPRSCWFVQIASGGTLGFDPSKPYVRTDQRSTDEAKDAYKDLIVEGNVEKELLYATLLSTDLLPFGFLDYRVVVLPIKPSGERFIMLTNPQAKAAGNVHLVRWPLLSSLF